MVEPLSGTAISVCAISIGHFDFCHANSKRLLRLDGQIDGALLGNSKFEPVFIIEGVTVVVTQTCFCSDTLWHLGSLGELVVRLRISLFTAWGEVIAKVVGSVACTLWKVEIILSRSAVGQGHGECVTRIVEPLSGTAVSVCAVSIGHFDFCHANSKRLLRQNGQVDGTFLGHIKLIPVCHILGVLIIVA